MSAFNKFRPFVCVIPEDDANRQLIDGFILHDAIADRVVQVMAPAGGWMKTLDVFENVYVPLLRGNRYAHIILLIDFDEVEDRRARVDERIPDDVKSRVFVISSKDEPETLKVEFGMTFEDIGNALADECQKDDFQRWNHAHLAHNQAELQRLVDVVKPILFQSN